MSNSVRKIFAYANSDFQQEGEAEGGLTAVEFKQLLDKFNLPMSATEYQVSSTVRKVAPPQRSTRPPARPYLLPSEERFKNVQVKTTR